MKKAKKNVTKQLKELSKAVDKKKVVNGIKETLKALESNKVKKIFIIKDNEAPNYNEIIKQKSPDNLEIVELERYEILRDIVIYKLDYKEENINFKKGGPKCYCATILDD